MNGMERLKRLGVFVLILALLGSGAALLFWETGRGVPVHPAHRAGGGGLPALRRRRRGADLCAGPGPGGLCPGPGGSGGERAERWRLTAEDLPRQSVPAALYPAAGGAVYLGLYNTEEETRLELYRVTEEGAAAQLLLSEPCPGENLRSQMAALTLSGFSQVDSVVTFALLEGDTATFYQRTSADSGLKRGQSYTQPGLRAAMALSDGTAVLACGDGLVRTDGSRIPLAQDGGIVTKLALTGTGICYVDGAGLQVFYADFTDYQPYPVLELEKDAYDLDGCTDLWITREGEALLLMGGDTLLLDRGSAVSDLTGMLYPSALRCALVLGGLCWPCWRCRRRCGMWCASSGACACPCWCAGARWSWPWPRWGRGRCCGDP